MRFLLALAIVITAIPVSTLHAHGGGLAADGCHNDRQNGGRHCHRGGGGSQGQATRSNAMGTYYPNCAAARAAGATPVRAGQPGYGRHLDRDGDGKGCE